MKKAFALSLLDDINTPEDLRRLDKEDLPQLAEEVRREMISAVAVTGGHLGAGLGVVELTCALHYVFNTPDDRLIWDVGHQAYPHKILTGRKDRIRSLRQGGGLSGFTKRSESEYDPFGAAHSSTSISAGLGMAVARDLKAKNISAAQGAAVALAPPNHVIAVIGDGAMSAGMAYEAMNNAGHLKNRLIVILNDNDMSIAPPTGAMSAYLSRLISGKAYLSMREIGKKAVAKLPPPLKEAARKAEEYTRGFWTGGTLFGEMGFYYVGPIDGHNFDHLLPVLENVKNSAHPGPILIHVVTKKGKGYAPAENAADKMHGVAKFDVVTGAQKKPHNAPPSYTKVFAESLIAEAKHDDKIVAVTAAMPAGTGLDLFEKAFPERMFDVGIAEQHAVTFAAGLAAEGFKPVCAIYSTFLQRAYDQVVHDVALQNLPVKFAIDRAGLVGADGATHAGSFDVAYLGCLPNFVLMAAADERELQDMTATMVAYNDGPVALRYPRGNGTGAVRPENLSGAQSAPGPELKERGAVLPIGKGRIVRQGKKIALLSYGARLQECLKAADQLAALGLSATVADARFAKPLDKELTEDLARNHEVLITIEEGSVGGFGAFVLQHLSDAGLLDHGLKVRAMVLPDAFIDHDTPEKQYAEAGLDAAAIVAKVRDALGMARSSGAATAL